MTSTGTTRRAPLYCLVVVAALTFLDETTPVGREVGRGPL